MQKEEKDGKQIIRISHKEPHAFTKLNHALATIIPKGLEEIVVLCIGTDRSSGDSFGPLVGRELAKNTFKHVYVYGNLEHPVHALNLEETLQSIKENHPRAYTIAIDAALGRLPNVGDISVSNTFLKPGEGVSKELPIAGDASIKGIVNIGGFMEALVLQNTRLYTVIEMAELTALSLKWVLRRYIFQESFTTVSR